MNVFKRLFSKDEKEKAFNYLFNNVDSESIELGEQSLFDIYMSDPDRSSILIMRANMKRVQDDVCANIMPKLTYAINESNQPVGFIVFNPHNLLELFNPLVKGTVDKLIPHLAGKLHGLCSVSLIFDSFTNKDLEQLIKHKYRHYVTEKDGSLYVELLPQEDFSLIFDFIDDVLYYC